MIVLSWNCRGLARPKGKRNLRAMVRDICPGILFLMELKISFEKVKPCLHTMGFYNAFFVDPVGKKKRRDFSLSEKWCGLGDNTSDSKYYKCDNLFRIL